MDRQLELFDSPKCKIDKKIRLIELFGGIGTQAMALRDIGADFERHRLVEFDKYSVQAYNSIHGTDFKPTDIRDVHGDDLGITDKDKYCYLLTYSFPCQSLSVAGKMAGMSRTDWEEGKSTRSGLLWEVERILRELPQGCLPDILVMENVTQIHNSKNAGDFNLWCEFLRSKEYVNHWKDLNGQDYGIPQHRERCFMVSILSDTFVDYEFPNPVPLEKVMKDFLEEDVDEKYYINSEKANKLIADLVARGELSEQRTKNKEQLTCALPDRDKSALPTALPQDATGESATSSQRETVLLRNMIDKNKEPSADAVDVACTLMARDYKGLSNYGANGVLECRT